MPLLSPFVPRPVLLVVADQTASAPPPWPEGTEVVECSSADAAWSQIVAGRRYSAVVAAQSDPHLNAVAAEAGLPVLTLDRPVDLDQAIHGLDRVPRAGWGQSARSRDRGGQVLAVCGAGGTGVSTVAAALAHAGLAEAVILADFALHADQAFLHGVADAVPGLLDLADISGRRPLGAADIAGHCLPGDRCRLLPGLLRASHWTAVSPPAFDAILDGVRSASRLVVADITGDLEGEADSGSIDVEERNYMARRTVAAADVVVAVGGPGPAGWRRLAGLVDDLLDQHVDPDRIQPVVNRAEPSRHGEPERRRLCGLPARVVDLPPFSATREPEADRPLAVRRDELNLIPGRGWVAAVAVAAADLLGRPPRATRAPSPVRVVAGTLGCAAP